MKTSTIRVGRIAALAIALVACTADRLTGPTAMGSSAARLSVGPAGPVVRISEVHYDNTGTDANERVEISGPAGVDLTGWQLVRYNGAVPGAAITYTGGGNPVLAGLIPNQCAGRGTVVLSYATDGLQNGPNDGFALVNSRGRVLEFLSYEGATTASNGPAAGMTSTNIPVSELGTATFLATGSIARTPTGGWTLSLGTNTFGACNDNDGNVTPDPDPTLVSMTITPSPANITEGASQTFTAAGIADDGLAIGTAGATWSSPNPDILEVNATTGAAKGLIVGDTKIVATKGTVSAEAIVHVVTAPPPLPTDLPPTRVSEFHYDNAGTDANEGVEIEADAGVSLSGWSLVFYTGNGGTVYNTVALSGVFTSTCNGRGALSFPIAGIQNGGLNSDEPDGFALMHGTTVVQFLSYEGTFTAADGPAAGLTSTDVGIDEPTSSSVTQSLQLNTAGVWERRTATMGQVNACAVALGTSSVSISHSGPDTLVVGWQRRAFVTFRDANGTTVTPTPTITWSSDTPLIATVDDKGYATAVSAGNAIIRATIGTTSGTYSFKVIDYQPVIAQYRNHIEFGAPIGANPANDIVLSKPGFVTSYNRARGGPNWVSWNINTSTFGDADRCECFSPDAALGATPTPDIPLAQRIGDQDYVGSGYDRGHMVQSESRTSTHSENATTFLMTNILPQAPNNNQGAWLGFENFLNDRARLDGKQVYVAAGGEYAASPTTLSGSSGRVAIPDFTWKVAIVVNNGIGLADVHTTSDITVYAVRIPNLLATAPANKSLVYAAYVTTVDDIEARTGYDFFAALPDNIENVVESNDRAPVAAFTGPSSSFEGATVAFDATTSSDPDAGDVLAYSWSFSNGATSTSATPTVTFADNGTYTATLTVTDKFGAASQLTKNITVSNVAPTITSFAGASINQGETYTASGSISDPGADTFTGSADYGDGTGVHPLAIAGASYSLAHTYANGGAFTVTVIITDDDGGSATSTATVNVNHTPVAVIGGAVNGTEGSTLSFNATGSTDADAGDVLSYQWSFSTGATSAQASPSIAFGDDGAYTATLTVTDNHGASSTTSRAITIVNVAPSIAPFAGATILRGESFSRNGSFSDPGPDTFTALVNYGDGTGNNVLPLSGGGFALSHTYATAGTFTVTITVSDDDGGSSTSNATVTVLSAANAIGVLSSNVSALEQAGTLSKGEANALDASLKNALKSVEKGNATPAANQLGAFINKVEAMRNSGRVSAATAAALIDYANRVVASMSS